MFSLALRLKKKRHVVQEEKAEMSQLNGATALTSHENRFLGRKKRAEPITTVKLDEAIFKIVPRK